MTDQPSYDVRGALLSHLIDRIEDDRFPSATMLDMAEQLLTPEDAGVYVELLLAKIAADTYPSVGLLRRVLALA